MDHLAVNSKDGVFWDKELPGFGIRVYPTRRKVYVVQARANGKSRRVTVGRHGDIAPDQACKDAAKIIARLKAGLPPVEQEPDSVPSVRRHKVDPHKERFLTPRELARLGRTLDIVPSKRLASRHAAAAIRLLVLTGCRRNEIMGLAWDDLDFEADEMRLVGSKSGPRIVPMPPAAAEVLAALPRTPDNRWVFPRSEEGRPSDQHQRLLEPHSQTRQVRRRPPS